MTADRRPTGLIGAASRAATRLRAAAGGRGADGGPAAVGRQAAARLAVPIGAAACTVAAAVPWLRAYRVPGAPVVIVAAAALPVVATTVVAQVLRRRPIDSYLVSLAGLVVLLVAISGPHPNAIRHALSAGPSRLLTETLPLSGGRALLAAPVVAVWISGALMAELLARSKVGTVALAVPVIAYLAAFAATSGAPDHDDLSGPVLLATLGITALAERQRAARRRRLVDVGADEEPRHATWGRGVLPGTLVVATVAVATALGASAFPAVGSDPADLGRPTPSVVSQVVDPLAAMASLRDTDPHAAATPELDVQTSGPSAGYLGLAILTNYDGATWTFDPDFTPTGGRVPPAPKDAPGAANELATVVTQRYHLLHRLPVPLVVSADRPLSVQGVAVAADAASGMIVPTAPVAPGRSYTVVSRAAAETAARLPAADGVGAAAGTTSAVARAATALPDGATSDIAAALRSLSPQVGQRPTPTLAYFQALVRALVTDEHRIDPAAPVPAGSTAPSLIGTSLAQVIDAVTVEHAATPEQYATLFVVVARYLGVPARLVTGFRAGTSGTGLPGPALPAGRYVVTNRQAWTWAEIPVAGLGWVVVDPTPAATGAAAITPPEQVSSTPDTLPRQANAVPKNQIAGGHAIARPTPIHLARSSGRAWWLDAVLVLVAALVVLLAAGPGLSEARRRRRRRARHRTDGAGLAVGAWLEVLDTLDRAGAPPGPTDSSAEVVALAGRVFGDAVRDDVRVVAGAADRALYSTAAPPDAAEAEQVWALQDGVRRQALATLDRRQRVHALLVVGHTPPRPGPSERDRGDAPAGAATDSGSDTDTDSGSDTDFDSDFDFGKR